MTTVGTLFSQQFSIVGATAWTVPSNVHYVTALLYGAGGKNTAHNGQQCIAGNGAVMSGSISVVPEEVLYVYIGGQGTLTTGGWNGGGSPGSGTTYQSGGGGGATDIRRSPYELVDRLIVAGGGGGTSCYWKTPAGGSGGYPSGEKGEYGDTGYSPGEAGTEDKGGDNGNSGCSFAGSFGKGGSMCGDYGSGGGGGWYGGGAAQGAGGGGGSSYFSGSPICHGV
ncbi:hypothetical protein B7Y94_06075 [Candidatus Saccharibacteria bacterium 32-49-12]|nr:MAG: hypothetical protein B7Y94_06075 [Candidatus Saccharibacteria bacterium 32-49-12]